MKKIIFFAFIVLIISLTFKTNETEITIPDDSIRLRVIPNSNKANDIHIKEKVKKYLENNIYQTLKKTSSIEEARYQINENVYLMEKEIEKIFKENNYEKNYKINFGYNYFPEKNYKGINYKEGMYESLVIEIGDANGDNWWCVLFPNFCLVDSSSNKEYKSYIYGLVNKMLKK